MRTYITKKNDEVIDLHGEENKPVHFMANLNDTIKILTKSHRTLNLLSRQTTGKGSSDLLKAVDLIDDAISKTK